MSGRQMNGTTNHFRRQTLVNKRTGAKVVVQGKVSRDQKIAQNLQHMRENAAKKRMAQEWYYNNKGRSPLIKPQQHNQQPYNHVQQNHRQPQYQQVTNNRQQNSGRPSVRQRLGGRPQYNFQPPKHGMQHNKIVRRNVPNNRIKTVSSKGQVVFLQPMKRKLKPNPSKLTVCVENDRTVYSAKHHVTAELDPKIQQEIKLIQLTPRHYTPDPYMQGPSVSAAPKLPIVTTGTTLNERFSMI